MPNWAAASMFVVTPTKCVAMSVPPWAVNHSRATLALASVSWVVKVFEATITSVFVGSRRRSTGAMSWPSTLETKWKRSLGCANSSSPITAICGPRSEPPMPMLSTSVKRVPACARTCSAYASSGSSTACVTATAASVTGLTGGAPAGARSAVCSTARPSVRLMGSPANIASRRASRPHSAARPVSSARVLASQRFLDRSAKTPGASMAKWAKRSASAAKAVRRSNCRPRVS